MMRRVMGGVQRRHVAQALKRTEASGWLAVTCCVLWSGKQTGVRVGWILLLGFAGLAALRLTCGEVAFPLV